VNNKLFACRLLPCEPFRFWSCTAREREREERSFGGTELWVILFEFFIFAVAQKEESFGW
jgi:hypothetical protein